LIGSGWKRLVPLCLERAGAAPLTANISLLDIEDDAEGCKGFLQALLPHVPRISHLSLTGYAPVTDVENILPGFFASPMLNLTSLELEQAGYSTEFFPSRGTPAPQLFQNISKLKSLHLGRTPLYPVLYNIESLVELKAAYDRAPFQKFIGFLESNPNLEAIDLHITFAEAPASVTPERVVSFPRLKRLALTCDNAVDSRALLSYLSLPQGINLDIYGSMRNSCGDLASFLPCPPTLIQDCLAPITTVKCLRSVALHLFSNDGSFSFRNHILPSKLCEEFNLFPTGAVREFHLHCRSYRDQGQLSWPLERLPALEALAFDRTSVVPGFLSALTKKPILCPSLKTIAFLNCMVSRETIDELEEVLAKRENSDASRLHRVVIVYGIYELPRSDMIIRLQRLVPRVDIMVGDELPDLL